MRWAIIQQVGRQGSNFLIFAVVSALVGPDNVGLLAMSMTWLGFVSLFSEMGFGAALVQRQEITEAHFNTAFAVNLASGAALTLLGVLLSWPASWFFGEPGVQPVMAVLSITLVLNAVSVTHVAAAQKQFQFRALAVRDITASVVGGAVGILLALRGFGVWSLVIHSIITAALASILIWRASPLRPRISGLSRKCFDDLWGYGSKMLLFSIFKYSIQNLDKVLIGYLLGPVALGFYTFAYRTVVTPINGVAGAVGNYLFARLSVMQSDAESVRKSYLTVNRVTILVVGPAVILIAQLGPAVVSTVLGREWEAASSLIVVFSVISMAQALISPVGQYMKALGKPQWLLYWSVLFASLTSLSIWLSHVGGITAIAAGLAGAHVLGVLISFQISSRLLSMPFSAILGGLASAATRVSPLLGTYLLVWALGFRTELTILAGTGVLAAGVYLLAIRKLDPDFSAFIVRRITRAEG